MNGHLIIGPAADPVFTIVGILVTVAYVAAYTTQAALWLWNCAVTIYRARRAMWRLNRRLREKRQHEDHPCT